MSDIPYSVRDKNIRVNAIKGFNFADINTNEMFKKVDENNVGGTDVISTQTSTSNKLTMNAGTGLFKLSVGVLEGITTLLNRSLHINVSGVTTRGMTIFDNGETARVGIGVTVPEEDLEVDGNIQIDGASNPRLKFQRTGASAHALSEIRAERDGTNGGDLQIRTKDVDGSVTEKLRINSDGAIGIIGANYGDAGAVLTSNGGTLPVSWVKPILFTVKKITDTGTANPIVGWETPEINIGGGTWTAVTGTYTVQSAGYYDINFQAQFRDPAPTSVGNFIAINVDGARVSEANNFFVNVAAGDEYLNMTVSKLILLSVGKLVTVQCAQPSGSNLHNSHFKIIRVAV